MYLPQCLLLSTGSFSCSPLSLPTLLLMWENILHLKGDKPQWHELGSMSNTKLTCKFSSDCLWTASSSRCSLHVNWLLAIHLMSWWSSHLSCRQLDFNKLASIEFGQFSHLHNLTNLWVMLRNASRRYKDRERERERTDCLFCASWWALRTLYFHNLFICPLWAHKMALV